jgi:hypothetical protein
MYCPNYTDLSCLGAWAAQTSPEPASEANPTITNYIVTRQVPKPYVFPFTYIN